MRRQPIWCRCGELATVHVWIRQPPEGANIQPYNVRVAVCEACRYREYSGSPYREIEYGRGRG